VIPSGAPSRRAVARGYLKLPHAVPVLVVLTATAAFVLIANGGWPGSVTMVRLLGAMLGAQLAIGVVNELVDAELDAVAKPDKPIPAGLVSLRGARFVAILGVLLMSLLSVGFGWAAFMFCALGAGTGIAYSVWLKRTMWSWIPYLVALPLIPIWVWSALGRVDSGLLAIYPVGAPAIVAVQVAQSLPDIEVDRQSHIRTLAVVLGSDLARFTSWGAMIVAASLAAVLALRLTQHADRVWIAAIVSTGLVGLNALIWRRNDRAGILACFPCVALGAGALGIGWAAALSNR
jgi:4-hydroxybenzoate polyprenyltransferase